MLIGVALPSMDAELSEDQEAQGGGNIMLRRE